MSDDKRQALSTFRSVCDRKKIEKQLAWYTMWKKEIRKIVFSIDYRGATLYKKRFFSNPPPPKDFVDVKKFSNELNCGKKR